MNVQGKLTEGHLPQIAEAREQGPERGTRKVRFTPEQDELIQKIVQEQGPGKTNWAVVAQHIEGKNAKQCRERYQHFLAPEIERRPWDLYEDFRLIQFHDKYGNDWAKIATMLPGRSNNDVKNRYNWHLRKQGQALDVMLGVIGLRAEQRGILLHSCE